MLRKWVAAALLLALPSVGFAQHGPVGSIPIQGPLNVSRGLVWDQSSLHKFGRNPEIDIASGYEALWNGGGDYTGHNATAAEVVEVFSSSDADSATNTGALTLEVFGLDAAWARQSETVILDGTNPVNTAGSYIRLDRARVRSAGSGGENAGSITVRQNVTTANVFAILPIGYNSTMIAATTIPAGEHGFILAWYTALAGKVNATVNVRFSSRPFGEVFHVQEEITISSSGTGSYVRHYETPKDSYESKTDIVMSADSNANDSGVAGGFDFILIAN